MTQKIYKYDKESILIQLYFKLLYHLNLIPFFFLSKWNIRTFRCNVF